MIHEVLPPGVENANESNTSAEVLWIAGQFRKRLGYGTEKDIVHDLLIHEDQWVQLRGDGKDNMEILNGQEVFLPCLYPLFLPQGLTFGTVPIPTGVIRYLYMTALITLVLMPAQL